MKNNANNANNANKYLDNKEDMFIKVCNGFGWVAVAIMILIGIKVLSFIQRKSILQLAIEGLSADTMTTVAMVSLGGLLICLVKFSQGQKMARQAKNYAYADYLEKRVQQMEEREKVYLKKV